MSSERASRALLAASDSLGQMAQFSWQQEQARAQAEREENLLRLRQKMSNEELDKRQGFDVANEETRVKNNLTLQDRETTQRAAETKDEREWRERQARTERGQHVADRTAAADLQRENWTRQDREAIERQAMTQIQAIDEQILSIQEGIAKGEYTDVKAQEDRVEKLIARRDGSPGKNGIMVGGIRQDTIARLADMGDPRYKEVQKPDGDAAPRAAQGPRPSAQAESVTPPPIGPWERRQQAKRKQRELLPASAPDKTAVRQRVMEFIKSGRALPGNIQEDFESAYGDMTNREIQSAWRLSLEEISLLRPVAQKQRR